MGIGDELMVTGRVRAMAAGKPRGWKVAVRDNRKPDWHRWHPIWNGNPRIARPGESFDAVLDDAPGNRPYVAAKSLIQWNWREYAPEPGEIFLTQAESLHRDMAAGRVVVNPSVKASASPNKLWPRESWQKLVDSAPDIDWLQIGEGGEPRLHGVPFLRTPTFREACGVLSGATAAVLHEGGLHHAAAAMGIPAVVIFGGFISPRVTGYASQASLFMETDEHPLGCGLRIPCFHCHTAMQGITPGRVLDELEHLL